MSEAKEIELLADIARLLKKYGADSFEALSKNFKDGRLLNDLLAILDASAKTGRRSSGKSGTKISPEKKKKGIIELLKHIEKADPEKANLLRQLHQNLVGKIIMPTLKDIRHFAEDNGLQPIKATGRDKAILPLLRDLAAISPDRVSHMVSKVPHREAEEGRTLEGWAGIILGNRSQRHEISLMNRGVADEDRK